MGDKAGWAGKQDTDMGRESIRNKDGFSGRLVGFLWVFEWGLGADVVILDGVGRL